MNKSQADQLNKFFVRTFNQIMSLEERALLCSGIGNVSVKELHLLEAVAELQPIGENTMSTVASRLDVSVGALTTAVNTLVKKGYLIRASREGDRRIVLVELTKSGLEANFRHEAFHKAMIKKVGEVLDENSLETLCVSLDKLSDFFEGLAK
ncbi:MAG: MarR family transcriptional regulator [Oscillospiraceae bacterium]